MRLESWWWLFLIPLLPLVSKFWSRANRPAAVRWSLPIPVEAASRDPIPWLVGLRCLALAFIALSLARPQWSFRQVSRTVSGVDILLVMDVSASMNIEDLADRSRLEIAKETMEGFIRGRENDRMGFVVFSGEPLTLSPLTLDYGRVLQAVHEATTGILKDGTAIGDGLAMAVSHLRVSKSKSRVIILLTDGDNNVGQVDPATAGELALGYGIRVYTIAIGREGRVRMPIRQKGVFGNTITTYQWFDNALNPELLEQIAKITQGKFYRVTDESALKSVFMEIDRLEKTDIQSQEKTRYEEAYPKILVLALLLLLVEQAISIYWRRAIL